LKVSFKEIPKKKTGSAMWLEYQYGWLPLMGDIYDAHQLLQKGFREKAQIASSIRVLQDEYHLRRDYSNFLGFDEVTSNATYVAKVFYKVDDTQLSRLGQMGLVNPASVAWELVPFSFVVDWFLPVGQYIEAMSATNGVTFIDGYYGVRCEGTYSSCQPNNPPADQTNVSDTRLQTNAIFGYTREKMTGFPSPALFLKSPFSTGHALNALALIQQLRK